MEKLLAFLVLIGSLNVSAVAAPPEKAGDIMEHLSFLGYKVSMDEKRITADHEEHLYFALKKYRTGMLATAFFGGSDYGKQNMGAFLQRVNELNRSAAVNRYYVDVDGDLAIEAFYPGEYDKQAFSAFMQVVQRAADELQEVDDIAAYLE